MGMDTDWVRISNPAWDDLTQSLIGRRLFSNQGRVDYDYPESAVSFQDNGGINDENDLVRFNIQKMHAMVQTGALSVFRLHLHWEQTSTDAIEFSYGYRIQENGQAKTTAWTEGTVDITDPASAVWDYATEGHATLNNISKIVEIDLSSAPISSTVQIKMTRSDNNGGVVLVTFADVHVPMDTLGSYGEFTKYKD